MAANIDPIKTTVKRPITLSYQLSIFFIALPSNAGLHVKKSTLKTGATLSSSSFSWHMAPFFCIVASGVYAVKEVAQQETAKGCRKGCPISLEKSGPGGNFFPL